MQAIKLSFLSQFNSGMQSKHHWAEYEIEKFF